MMKDIDLTTQLKKGLLDIVALALVEKGDKYGYELTQMLVEATNISEGTIYPILRRMKDNEMLTTYLSDISGGPPRKYYKITEKGREVLEKEKKQWLQLQDNINQILEN